MMRFATLVLLTSLSAVLLQDAPSTAIKTGGHTYQLFCAREGEMIAASDTGLCEKTESGGVLRFEVRNEAGEAQFSQDAPAGKPFTYVGIFAFANAGQQVLDLDTSRDDTGGSGPKPVHLIYYLDPSPSGLVPFNPPLVDVDGFTQIPSGVALSRTFDAGFFRFSVLLDFNSATHRIEIMPDQAAFSAFPPRGRQKSGTSPGLGAIKLYASHGAAASKTDITLAPGHRLKWWQSPDMPEMSDKPTTGPVLTILAAWAPASLKQADNAPDGVKMVYFDWNNLWLQIQVDDHTGWIRGSSSFRAIGLTMPSGPQ
jgi:hypothetical protein